MLVSTRKWKMAHKMQLEMNLERDCTVPGTRAHSVRSVAFTLPILYTPYIMLYRAGHWHIYTHRGSAFYVFDALRRVTLLLLNGSVTPSLRNGIAYAPQLDNFPFPLPLSLTPPATHPFPCTTTPHTHTSTAAPPLSATFLISAWAKTNEN